MKLFHDRRGFMKRWGGGRQTDCQLTANKQTSLGRRLAASSPILKEFPKPSLARPKVWTTHESKSAAPLFNPPRSRYHARRPPGSVHVLLPSKSQLHTSHCDNRGAAKNHESHVGSASLIPPRPLQRASESETTGSELSQNTAALCKDRADVCCL